jgi:Family of unknown function (DUF5906)
MPVLYALSASDPLTKTIEQTPQGLVKTPYPMVRDFTSHAFPYETLSTFAAHVRAVAERNWCLLKGTLSRELRNESRAGSTDPDAPTDYICLDFDSAEAPTVDALLERIGLADVSHFIQYSSSHGLTPGRISAHVFMLLEQPTSPRVLKEWLQHLNLAGYKPQIGLNRLGTALRWPLDITTCQNDKLLYIAPARFVGMPDPVAERFELVTRTHTHVPGRRIAVNFNEVSALRTELLHELRKAAGLPKLRDTQYKVLGTQEYLSKPGKMTITGVKEARGYRYFNLNGGDSWAYFQPLDDHKFVHNFKGEPAYLLQEIAPEYFASVVQRMRQELTARTEYFSFISPADDAIYNAALDKEAQVVELFPCSTERRAHMFLKGNGMPIPEELPLMDVVYEPKADFVIDHAKRMVNVFRPTSLSYRTGVTEIPPTINRVIDHAVGTGDIKVAFLKWVRCACIQNDHTGIAWILSGDEGTGKGVLFHRILTPLVGHANAVMVPMTRLVDQYNAWLENKLLVAIDEAQLSALGRDAALVESKLKSWITEPTTQLRKMHTNPRSIPNYANFLLLSNKPDPSIVSAGDRRHQVGRYQPTKIVLTEQDIDNIDNEVAGFYSWLVDRVETPLTEVRKIVDHTDRRLLIDLSLTTIDSVAKHLHDGDLEFLFAQLDASKASDTLATLELTAYKSALHKIALRALNCDGQLSHISRDELYAVLNYLAGNVRNAPFHFTTLLKHHRIYLQPKTPLGVRGQCMHVQWKIKSVEDLRDLMDAHLKQEMRNDVSVSKAA